MERIAKVSKVSIIIVIGAIMLLATIFVIIRPFNSSDAEKIVITQASEESVNIAEKIVQQLSDLRMFDPGLGITTNSQYSTAQSIVPELIVLEKKNDAAQALLGCYEKLLSDIEHYDAVKLIQYCKEKMDDASAKPIDEKLDKEFDQWWMLLMKRDTIEALLSIDTYYDKMSQEDCVRMHNDFKIFEDYMYDAERTVYDDSVYIIPFDIFRNQRESLFGLGL